MAGTIVVDRIESDASYASTINVAGQITFSNTVNFGATAQRITGDFSNATVASRVAFQSSTTNGNTIVGALPNGTATTSTFNAYNSSDAANNAYIQLAALSTEARVGSTITGTGTYLPMTFHTGGSERMRIDTSGNLLLGATSNTAAPTGYISAANTFGFKNRIINGAASIWQRNTTFSSINNAITYGSDRFFAFTTSATAQAQILRSTSVPAGFLYSQQFGRAASNTATAQQFLCQCIESWNMLDLTGQTVTLSFWAKAGANYSGGSLSIKLSTGTTADQSAGTFSAGPCTGYTGNQAAINATQAITTTWTQYTFTSSAIQAGALSMGLGIGYTPTGTAGADDNIYITGVQLEKGSTATSFDYRPYSTELALCQRYYYRTTSLPLGYIINIADLYAGLVKFPVTMRTTPTLDSSGNSWAVTGGSAGTVGLRSGTGWGPNSDQAVTYNASSNWSAGNAAALTAGFSAEL